MNPITCFPSDNIRNIRAEGASPSGVTLGGQMVLQEAGLHDVPKTTASDCLQIQKNQEKNEKSFLILQTSSRKRKDSRCDEPEKSQKRTKNLCGDIDRRKRVQALEDRLENATERFGATGLQPASTLTLASALERVVTKAEAFNNRVGGDSEKSQSSTQSGSSGDTNDGLNILFERLIHRRLRKIDQEDDRYLALRRSIGEAKYAELVRLVREVHSVQLGTVAVSCTGGVCGRLQRPSFPVDIPRVLPKEVKDMFFGVRLTRAFKDAPIGEIGSTDWEVMMKEATEILSEYRRWKKSQEKEATAE